MGRLKENPAEMIVSRPILVSERVAKMGKPPNPAKSCGNCCMLSAIAIAVFFILLAGGYLAFQHLSPKAGDELRVRKRSHLRTEKDSDSENSHEHFVKHDSWNKKAFKKVGKGFKWLTFPVWAVPYMMYKNQTFEKCAGFGIVLALMIGNVPGGIVIMMSMTLFFIGMRHFMPLNPPIV